MKRIQQVSRLGLSVTSAGVLLIVLTVSLWAATYAPSRVTAVSTTSPLTRITTGASDRDSFGVTINSDGRKIAFYGDADLLGQGVPDNQREIWLYDMATMTVTRLTTGASNRNSFRPSINGDGRKIAFAGDADLLGQGLPDNQFEIWLYDTATMTVTRVTTGASNRNSFRPSINGDGRKIAFAGDADLLGQGLPDNQFEIWLYDTATMTVTRVTTGTNGRFSLSPKISSDGSKIVFYGDADFLGQGVPAFQYEIWLYNMTMMTVTRVTTGASGRSSEFPTINGDGSKIAFRGDVDFLGQGIPAGQNEIWLYDTATMTVTRVTTGASGRSSESPTINSDGSKIAFYSDADLLGQGIPAGQNEIWLYDTAIMTVTRVTTGASGRSSESPTINSDGSKIAFYSDADLLGQGIPANQNEIWLYDTATMTVTRVTTGASDRDSSRPTINNDGSKIAFQSNADFLGQGIPVDQGEIWLYDGTTYVYLPVILKN